MELFGIETNEKECSRSVPIRYVPLHRKDGYWHNHPERADLHWEFRKAQDIPGSLIYVSDASLNLEQPQNEHKLNDCTIVSYCYNKQP